LYVIVEKPVFVYVCEKSSSGEFALPSPLEIEKEDKVPLPGMHEPLNVTNEGEHSLSIVYV
jgi:hypothetical protein